MEELRMKRRNIRSGADLEKNRSLFDRLYLENYDLLLQFSVRMLGAENLMAAEDIVQDTFFEALKHIELLKDHENPQGWLMVTARNKIRALRRRASSSEVWYDEKISEPFFVDSQYGAKELNMILAGALSPRELALFRKYFIEGYSVREMAGQEHMTESAFKVKMFRIRKKVQQICGMVGAVLLMLALYGR